MEFREIFQRGKEMFKGKALPAEQSVDVKSKILSGLDLPPRDDIIAAFLKTSLLVQPPQLTEKSDKGEKKPDWLKSVYRRSSDKAEQCKYLAILLSPLSEVPVQSTLRVLMAPLLSEEGRKKIVAEIAAKAPMLESREDRLAEVIRLTKINFKSTGKVDLITPFEAQLAQKRKSEEILHSLSDEDLKDRLTQERQRIANDALSDIRLGGHF